MGGVYQHRVVEVEDTKELTKVYSDIVSSYQWSHGHGGYSGTLAEKPVLRIIDGLWDEHEARDHCIDENDKHGSAFAYKLKDGNEQYDRYYIGGWCSS